MMYDQAQKLRRIFANSVQNSVFPKKIISITSGKGGTGKTFLSVNLAHLFAKENKRVLLIDFDLNLASAEILMNHNTEKNIVDFFNNEILLEELIQKNNENLDVIFANSGTSNFYYPTETQINFFCNQLKERINDYDYIIIDTGAGVSPYTLNILERSDFIFFVITPEPTSVMDAYVLIKYFYRKKRINNFAVITNKVDSEIEGLETHNKLQSALTNFLKIKVPLLGCINLSSQVHQSLVHQEILVESSCDSKTAIELQNIKEKVEKFVQLYNSSQPNI
ncbi:AAA family ATPase [Melioribacteraceae bacterium 4301-Me]|uniref:AAA family ATPase n=1 Tax=Pyranulibacter aquaticus TaxID=3163344 RepID=UPI00359AC136